MNRLTSLIRRNKAYSAIVVLGFALIALDLLGFHVGAWIGEKVGPSPLEVLGASVTDYNFTSNHVVYQLGERSGGGINPDTTNGHSSACCYKPDYEGQPLTIKWSYYGGLYGKTDGHVVWHYEATLNPPFPQGKEDLVFTVRFYPGGRVAVRYTDKPESTYDDDRLSPVLHGPDWVQAQGTPLPALLEIEQKVRDAGRAAELETRPAPAIPTAAEATARTADLTSPENAA